MKLASIVVTAFLMVAVMNPELSAQCPHYWTTYTGIQGSVSVQSGKICEEKVHTSSSVSDTDSYTSPFTTDADIVTYLWSKSSLSNPQTGQFVGDLDESSVTWTAPPCTGTVKITLTLNDQPKSITYPDTGSRNDSSTNKDGTATVSLPSGCSNWQGTETNTLSAPEIGSPNCSENDCGKTTFPSIIVYEVFTPRYSSCEWKFWVEASGPTRSDPCPGNFTEISDANDPDVTSSNVCTLIQGFRGNSCFGVVGGDCYGNSACTEIHEDKHLQDFQAELVDEACTLTQNAIMRLSIDCSNDNTKTCAAAKDLRQGSIAGAIQAAYNSAWGDMHDLGEGPAVSAAALCYGPLADSLCDRAASNRWGPCPDCPPTPTPLP